MRRGAGDFFRIEVERDFELDVLDVGIAVARPFRLDVLRLKRAASAGESDGEGLVIAKLHGQLIEKSRLVHGRDVMNRVARTQTGKSSEEIECGAARPAPAAGVTPAPDEAQNADGILSRALCQCGENRIFASPFRWGRPTLFPERRVEDLSC